MPRIYDVVIEVHADQRIGTYRPIWNWFGYDEPNCTYTAHGKKLLGELAALSPEPVRIRTHNLLTSGDGTYALKWGSTNAYAEDAAGPPVYDWTIMDRIFDAYVATGCIPLIQAGFTPEPLSDHAGPYRHSWSIEDRYATITTGWAAPPNDLKKWGDLIFAWARHLADRYGQDRVTEWPWEVWNEPDGHYWMGTIAEFCALYDVTARAIKRALPGARVGGPHTCGPFAIQKAKGFLRTFLRHVVDSGSPIDFVAFHAKGNPVLHDGHVRMGLHKQQRDIEAGLAIVNEFPSLARRPVILGESDPEGCAACSARAHPQNGYRNGPLYGVYAIESMLRTYELADRAGMTIEGAVTWAFLFEGQPWFDGFRDLATNGVDKAVLNAFRMLGMLGGDWLATTSSHALKIETILEHGVRDAPDISAVATHDDKGISLLVWNYHDNDVDDGAANISVSLTGVASGRVALRHYRMDREHSNGHRAWQEMGSSQAIAEPDVACLEAAGQLAMIEDAIVQPVAGVLPLATYLPRQGVSLFRLLW